MSGANDNTSFAWAGFADSLPNQVCVLDGGGRVVYVNAAWRRFADDNGYCGGPFVGLDYLRICEDSDGAEAEDAHIVGRGLRAVLTGERDIFEHVYPCHAPDHTRWFRLQATRLDGGLVLQHVPASDPVRAEKELVDILSHLAHELRTPLSAISGYSDLLQVMADRATPEQRQSFTAAIRQSSGHLAGVIDDMLDLARSRDGTQVLSLNDTTCDLYGVMAAASDMVSGLAREREIAIVLRPPREDVEGRTTAVIDQRRLTQVLLNLLTNAVKFSPRGSTVICTLRFHRSGGLMVEVSDSGPGMSADEIPVALSPYGRTSSAVRTGAVGLGLGLPLSKALMELHGGSLALDSVPGRGTTASVSLPAWRCLTRRTDTGGRVLRDRPA